jgi:hypothetical protein
MSDLRHVAAALVAAAITLGIIMAVNVAEHVPPKARR